METLAEKAQRLGMKPAGKPVATSTAPQGETLAEKAQRLGMKPATPQDTSATPFGTSFLGQVGNTLSNIGAGAGAEIGKAGLGLGELALKGLGKIGVPTEGAVKGIQDIKQKVYEDPFKNIMDTTSGKVGQAVGIGAEFMVPNTAILKGQKIATGLTNLIPATTKTMKVVKGTTGVLGRAVPEAIAGGAVELARTGGDTEAAKTAGTIQGGISTVFGSAGAGYRGIKQAFYGPEESRVIIKAIKPTGYLAGKGAESFKKLLPTALDEVKKTGLEIKDLNSFGEATKSAMKNAWDDVIKANETGKNTNINTSEIGVKIFDSVKNKNSKILLENPEELKTIRTFVSKYMGRELTVPEAQDILTQTNALLKDYYRSGVTPANATKFNLEKQLNIELADQLRTYIDNSLEAIGTGSAQPLRDKYRSLAMLNEAIQGRIPKEERLANVTLGQQFNLPMGVGKMFAGAKSGNVPLAIEGASQIATGQLLKDLNKSETQIQQVFGTQKSSPLTNRLFGGYKTESPIVPPFGKAGKK